MVWTNFNIFDLFVRVCVLLFFITTWHDDPRWHPLPIYFFGLIHLPSNAVVFLFSVLSQRHSEFGLESMDRLPCRSWSQLSGNFHQIAAFDIPVLEEKSSLDVEARLMRQLSVCHLCKPRTLWHNMNRLVSNVVGLKGPEPLFAVCILFFLQSIHQLILVARKRFSSVLKMLRHPLHLLKPRVAGCCQKGRFLWWHNVI